MRAEGGGERAGGGGRANPAIPTRQPRAWTEAAPTPSRHPYGLLLYTRYVLKSSLDFYCYLFCQWRQARRVSRSTRRRRRPRRRHLSRYALRLTSFGRHYPPTIACRVSSGRLTALASSPRVRTAGVCIDSATAPQQHVKPRLAPGSGAAVRAAFVTPHCSSTSPPHREHTATSVRAQPPKSPHLPAIVPAPACTHSTLTRGSSQASDLQPVR